VGGKAVKYTNPLDSLDIDVRERLDRIRDLEEQIYDEERDLRIERPEYRDEELIADFCEQCAAGRPICDEKCEDVLDYVKGETNG
jgi:hypothetical protein